MRLAQHVPDQLLVAQLLRVEFYAHRLGVACDRLDRMGSVVRCTCTRTIAAAHAVVGRVVALPARVADRGRHDSRMLIELGLRAPKSPEREDGNLCAAVDVVVDFAIRARHVGRDRGWPDATTA
eukprot:2814673-Prymnesium_polylepis.1